MICIVHSLHIINIYIYVYVGNLFNFQTRHRGVINHKKIHPHFQLFSSSFPSISIVLSSHFHQQSSHPPFLIIYCLLLNIVLILSLTNTVSVSIILFYNFCETFKNPEQFCRLFRYSCCGNSVIQFEIHKYLMYSHIEIHIYNYICVTVCITCKVHNMQSKIVNINSIAIS